MKIVIISNDIFQFCNSNSYNFLEFALTYSFPMHPFSTPEGMKSVSFCFFFFSSRKPYIIRNVPETWRDGDGNVYLLRINPVNSLVRDFLSRLFFQFCSERKNIVFNAVCGMSDHLWKNSKKMKETYKKTQAKIAHKRNKLMFNIFFLGSLWLNSYEPFLCHIFILHVISLLLV